MKFGLFFAENILKGKKKLHKVNLNQFLFSNLIFDKSDIPVPQVRFAILTLIVMGFFFLIIGRLIYLQIFHGEMYRKLANGNRVYTKRLIALRGIITDRYGQPLVVNEPDFLMREGDKFKKLSPEEAMHLEADNPNEFKKVEITGKRKYLFGEAFSHVLGYLGEVNPEELKSSNFQDYKSGDELGRTGIEQFYESKLKGKNGEEYFEVTSRGDVINKIGEKPGVAGENIRLTIDASLQKMAYQALQEAKNDPRYQGGNIVKGTVIVSSVSTGEILAMVSSPSYDESGVADAVNDNKNFPLMNRAISATYPPGSTFKIVVATAGLESGRITKKTLIEDTGIIKIGKWEFPTWSSIRDGMVDIVKGIRRSNDIFFYKVGEMTGLNLLQKYAGLFGLGHTLGIDLPSEASGLIPTNAWKQKTFGESWFLGDTYHIAIGQGFLLSTPLQVNSWTNTVASRGRLYRPHLLLNQNPKTLKSENPKKIISNSKFQIPKESDNYLIRDLHLRKETVDLIWRGMKEACQAGGTGWPLFDFKIPVACKTGTAEFGDEATHAWFTLFAPLDKPEIAVTVLIENGGQGSDVAAPVARKVLEKYFGVK